MESFMAKRDWLKEETGFKWRENTEQKGGRRFMKMSVFAFTFTITVKKRKETLAEAIREERLRHIQDTMIDKRVQYNVFN